MVLALVWAQGEKKYLARFWLGSQGKRRPRKIEVGRKVPGKKAVEYVSETLKSCVTSMYQNV